MITTILSDFSFVILFPKDKKYRGKLNDLNTDLTNKLGKYNFFEYFELNSDLLEFYKSLKSRYSINIFTSGNIQNNEEVRKVINPFFEKIYTAKEFNLEKNKPQAYKIIAKKLNKEPGEIIFIDDQKENVQAAQEAGLKTVLYKDLEQLKSELKKVLI